MLAPPEPKGIVISMIGAKYLPEAIADSYYWSFHANYYEAETRRQNALTLVPGNPAREQEWQYPTRAILATQWDDTPQQGLETARLLYSLSPTLIYYTGQSVLKLTGIDYSEIKNLRNGGELPPYGFSIDIGQVDETTHPEYGFRRTPKNLRPSGVNPDATLLDYQVTLPVLKGPSLEVDHNGKVEVNEPIGKRADFLAYMGRVCLEADRTLYRQTRYTEVGNVVFGNGRSFGAVYELLKHVGGPQNEAFQEMFEHDKVSPTEPLMNLDSLIK